MRAGAAQTRQNEKTTGAVTNERQNVQATGNTHISGDRAEKIAQTLRATSSTQKVNINVRIGANLPGNVDVRPLPPSVVELVPEFRGYDYVVANDEIVIVQPSTRQVVEVINEGGQTQAMAATHVNPCGP